MSMLWQMICLIIKPAADVKNKVQKKKKFM